VNVSSILPHAFHRRTTQNQNSTADSNDIGRCNKNPKTKNKKLSNSLLNSKLLSHLAYLQKQAQYFNSVPLKQDK
jgi:hypothetical protein